MGTALGLLFIVAAAAAGVFVGTRPTVMDGRWIAAKLGKAAPGEGAAIECDREIPVGVAGAEFACSDGAGTRVRFKMTRDGKLERRGSEQPRRGRVREAEEAEPADGAGEPGDD